MNKLRYIWGNIKRLPTGFRNVFNETKEAYGIVRKSWQGKNLQRKESIFLQSTYEAWQKIGLYWVLQLPPIIGIIPSIVAITYPKQMLSRHFWSDEQNIIFAKEELAERRNFYLSLLKDVPMNTRIKFHPPDSLLISDHEWNNNFGSDLSMLLSNISYEHLRCLASATGICNSKTALLWAPTIMLRAWLYRRALSIAKDDALLIKEGTESLSTLDLQLALIRRGLNPFQMVVAVPQDAGSLPSNSNMSTTNNKTPKQLLSVDAFGSHLPDAIMRRKLENWLSDEVVQRCRRLIVESGQSAQNTRWYTFGAQPVESYQLAVSIITHYAAHKLVVETQI